MTVILEQLNNINQIIESRIEDLNILNSMECLGKLTEKLKIKYTKIDRDIYALIRLKNEYLKVDVNNKEKIAELDKKLRTYIILDSDFDF